MKPIRKAALVVMTLSIAAAAGQVVQGNAAHRTGDRVAQAPERPEPGALPRLPMEEARLPAHRISLAGYVPSAAPPARQ